MQLYRFKTDKTLIDRFINGGNANEKIYEVLSNRTFALDPQPFSRSSKLFAVDEDGHRILSEYSYDFSALEVETYLVEIDPSVGVDAHQTLVEWVKVHNHGELPFNKALKMYNIAIGETV